VPVRAAGLVLAAGGGSRYGQAKATVVEPDGTSWLRRATGSLLAGGCDHVLAVLGAECGDAVGFLDGMEDAGTIVADDWADGLGASLRAGLAATAERSGPEVEALVITLVDLPDVGADAVVRLLASPGIGPETLLRATYDGRPGHPAVVGRHHWEPLAASVAGDRGAAAYLVAHGATTVECGDLATGRDVDSRRPEPR
jgi:molybdenum cofactor cytidylyltransferase/nicotine blue oxidoreductase